MRPLPVLLALALLALPAFAPLAGAAPAPLAVLVVPTAPGLVQVSWTGPMEPVMGHRVYVRDGGLVMLLATLDPGARSITAPAGFDDYGVSTFGQTGESAITWYGKCVTVGPGSPPVTVTNGAC